MRAESHPFSVHDLWAMERIADPQVSPDGRWIVFDRKTYDLTENKGTSNLWLVGADGTGLRRLTTHEAGSTNPRWAPDGKTIWFLSSRSGSTQAWRIAVDGGEAERVTDEPLDVGNLIVSPDGRFIAFSMNVFPDATPQDTKRRLDEREKNKTTGVIHDQLFIRHWDTWKDGRRSHIFVTPADGGDAIDIMATMNTDAPSVPFGGPEEFTFTPDSSGVVFSAARPGRNQAWSTQHDLYLAPIDGRLDPRCLTDGNKAWITNPTFSPDGTTLACLAMSRPGYESDRWRIVLGPWPNGAPRILTEEWDRSPSTIVWSADGGTIYTVGR